MTGLEILLVTLGDAGTSVDLDTCTGSDTGATLAVVQMIDAVVITTGALSLRTL